MGCTSTRESDGRGGSTDESCFDRSRGAFGNDHHRSVSLKTTRDDELPDCDRGAAVRSLLDGHDVITKAQFHKPSRGHVAYLISPARRIAGRGAQYRAAQATPMMRMLVVPRA